MPFRLSQRAGNGRMPRMAKRKRKKPMRTATQDRHASGFMVRLPAKYRELVKQAGDSELPITVKVRRAIDLFIQQQKPQQGHGQSAA